VLRIGLGHLIGSARQRFGQQQQGVVGMNCHDGGRSQGLWVTHNVISREVLLQWDVFGAGLGSARHGLVQQQP
jgi:hypothetical protein